MSDKTFRFRFYPARHLAPHEEQDEDPEAEDQDARAGVFQLTAQSGGAQGKASRTSA
ncbi:MAG: hypothetical protein JXR49_04770 [Acidobacteria bacterium]|nr:hypothetical protein [Acidobacteriota bacterium]